jgi:hypothetical protein
MATSMERPLKLWEFIIGCIGIFLTVSVMIYNRGTMDAQNQVEINSLKQSVSDLRQKQDKIDEKLDRIHEDVTNVLVLLQNKEDRKK